MPAAASFTGMAAALSAQLRCACAAAPARAVSGGCISACYRWESDSGPLFVKIAGPEAHGAFEAEADGLRELESARALRVPRVLGVGSAADGAFLALEWIESAPAAERTERLLGERLAEQHRVTAQAFGWRRDNTLGRTPQPNGWMSDWAAFFRERRLRPQLELAAARGFGALLAAPGERLLEALPALLGARRLEPSLLHGDLWGGNWFADARGEPVIFDPATYYGDREADVAMTHLFGGFGREFYAAYAAGWPLEPGHEARRELYNLYHLLNHANLFGAPYARQARQSIDALAAQLRG